MVCQICTLPIRDHIEKMYLENKSIAEIFQYCLDNGYTNVSYRMLQYHFSEHMTKSKSKVLLDTLYKQIELFSLKLDNVLKTKSNEMDIADITNIMDKLSYLSKVLEQLKELEYSKDSDELIQYIYTCLPHLPKEWADVLIQGWEIFQEEHKKNPRITKEELKEILEKRGVLIPKTNSNNNEDDHRYEKGYGQE